MGGISLPNLKSFYKASVIKTEVKGETRRWMEEIKEPRYRLIPACSTDFGEGNVPINWQHGGPLW